MLSSTSLFIVVVFATITVFSDAFVKDMFVHQRSMQRLSMKMNSQPENTGEKIQFNNIAASLLALTLTNSFVSIPQINFHSVEVARADFRAAQKTTYFRFSPKFITGRDYYRNELKQAIDKEQWDVVTKFFEQYAAKINKNDPNQVDQYDSYVNLNLERPMKVLAGSFAERGSSTKQKLLLDQEVAFEKAMESLEGCVKDRKDEGFFAATIKMPTGQERTKQGKTAYAEGLAALDGYVKILNNGLMLELNKIPL